MADFKELALETIQSQYAASPRIKGIVQAFAAAIDPNADIDLFYKKIMDLDTAEGIGLDIWGVIVGIGRVLEVEVQEPFGFLGSLLQPFNQAPFHKFGVTDYYRLTDEAYRKLIYYKAMANIASTEISEMNRLLAFLYPQKPVYVLEVGVMRVRYVFEFTLLPYELSFFRNYGGLVRSAGVGMEWYQIEPACTFGFDGSGLQPFGQGVFDVYGLQDTTKGDV